MEKKKIVVITGSPRKNGNSLAMTKAFIQVAQEKGPQILRFDAANKNLGDCHACETGYKTGKACTFDDDFNLLHSHVSIQGKLKEFLETGDHYLYICLVEQVYADEKEKPLFAWNGYRKIAPALEAE
ncbi:MAG: NAD(P)H-dependent oxidoreductase [Allobaculum sp.]|nr:NAD(P)H-dependent oxidoreductase [Allobaculum sp.]